MTEFIITPTNVDYLESIFRNPISGNWTIPILTFNTNYMNPYYDNNPLNSDPKYQKRVIDNFYMRLTEKWLYKNPIFSSLLKYFKIEKSGDEGRVSLISNIKEASNENYDKGDRKHIFKYIEKVFISKKFVEKVIRQYVKRTNIKWYDLFYNTDVIKDLLKHKLKKLIVSTIYELDNMKKVDKFVSNRVNNNNEILKNNDNDDDDDNTWF